MSPVTVPISWPALTWSPSFTKSSIFVFSSKSWNALEKTCNPQITPSSLQIKSTCPIHDSGITAFVVTSSLVTSSFKALSISGSTVNFNVIGSNIFSSSCLVLFLFILFLIKHLFVFAYIFYLLFFIALHLLLLYF